jgi:predicted ATPase
MILDKVFHSELVQGRGCLVFDEPEADVSQSRFLTTMLLLTHRTVYRIHTAQQLIRSNKSGMSSIRYMRRFVVGLIFFPSSLADVTS